MINAFPKTTLVLQSFGNEVEYSRALFTIYSYYAHTSLSQNDTRVILFTDNPDYFLQYVQGLPVDYVLLTPEKIKQMRGQIDFLHRMKIALIAEAFEMIQGPLLYVDSDTFFIADPTSLTQQLSPGRAFMHVLEYKFESMRTLALPGGETFHAFVRLTENEEFTLAKGNRIEVSPAQVSWNAGAMFFHPDHAQFIPDVYALTDQFYPPTKNHASEQYAFSVIMQNNTELLPCNSVIYHYWYRVKKKVVDLFLEEKLNKDWANKSLKEKLQQVKIWCDLLPSHFEKHLLTVQDNAIQALNDDRFSEGYRFALKALSKKPSDKSFIRNILYHTKRRIIGKRP